VTYGRIDPPQAGFLHERKPMACRKSRGLANLALEQMNVWYKSNITALPRSIKQNEQARLRHLRIQKIVNYQIINGLMRCVFLHGKGLHGIPSTSDSGLPMVLSAGKR
jgi:hypothetical protein